MDVKGASKCFGLYNIVRLMSDYAPVDIKRTLVVPI